MIQWITWHWVGVRHAPPVFQIPLDQWMRDETVGARIGHANKEKALQEKLFTRPSTHARALQFCGYCFFFSLSSSQTMPHSFRSPGLNKRVMQIKVALISLQAGNSNGYNIRVWQQAEKAAALQPAASTVQKAPSNPRKTCFYFLHYEHMQAKVI